MRKMAFALVIASLSIPSVGVADKFVNTGPGTINTCETSARVGIGVSNPDSLTGPYYNSMLMIGTHNETGVGGALQLNMPPGNENGFAATFDVYMHGGYIPALRILNGNNQGSWAEVSNWNLSTGDFWASGTISSSSGFWVNSTQLNVPDYVFEPDYKLRSLEETEIFVKENKHLPEIPSATAIKNNGMNLSEMNLKLLQKVEELTLHAIDQGKRIKSLEAALQANQGRAEVQR